MFAETDKSFTYFNIAANKILKIKNKEAKFTSSFYNQAPPLAAFHFTQKGET